MNELAEAIITFFAVLCLVSIMIVITAGCWSMLYDIWRGRE